MPTERKKPAKDAPEVGRKTGQQARGNEANKTSSPSHGSDHSKTGKSTKGK